MIGSPSESYFIVCSVHLVAVVDASRVKIRRQIIGRQFFVFFFPKRIKYFYRTNKLNIFPSCTQCNQTKGCNSLLDWLTMNVVVSNWSSEQINTFQNWLSLNGSKLLFDSEYFQRRHSNINQLERRLLEQLE